MKVHLADASKASGIACNRGMGDVPGSKRLPRTELREDVTCGLCLKTPQVLLSHGGRAILEDDFKTFVRALLQVDPTGIVGQSKKKGSA